MRNNNNGEFTTKYVVWTDKDAKQCVKASCQAIWNLRKFLKDDVDKITFSLALLVLAHEEVHNENMLKNLMVMKSNPNLERFWKKIKK